MSRVHAVFTEPPRRCEYLRDERATLDYRIMSDVTPEEFEPMLVRGWRRFGPVYFRPGCSGCSECVSLRVPVASFTPTPSQQRARRRCGRFRIELGAPHVDAARLALYARWHTGREATRGWRASPLDTETYFQELAFPHPCVRELALYDGDQLLMIGIHDVTPAAWSAVYCFYDPVIARLSPGVANVLLAIEQARQLGIPHVYLGYRVLGCPSSRYKAQFRPHELLQGRPAMNDEPHWLASSDTADSFGPPSRENSVAGLR
jgi:arginine-tRNA-protein transferase